MRVVIRTRLQQFHDGLVVVAIGWGEQDTQDHPAQTGHALDCAADGRHRVAAPQASVGSAQYIVRVLPT